jgi:hypothetical protein
MTRTSRLGLVAVSLLALAACSKGGDTKSAAGAAASGGAPAAASPATGPDTAITEADLPHIKAGKWQKVETDETGKTETSTYCESGKPIRMAKPPKEQCARYELKRTFLGGLVMDMQCGDPKQYQMTAHASASGDFNSHMVTDLDMKVEVPGRPPVVSKIHTDATYVGACDAGDKGGDAE